MSVAKGDLERAISTSIDCIMEDTIIVDDDGNPLPEEEQRGLKQDIYMALLSLENYKYEGE